MSIDFIRPEVDELRPRISVIGVGGAGGNAIANMMRADVQGVDFVVANTDAQALNNSTADPDHADPRAELVNLRPDEIDAHVPKPPPNTATR